MDEDTFTVDKGVEPRIAAAEKLQGLAHGESAMVDRTRSRDGRGQAVLDAREPSRWKTRSVP